jgi:hypothetical protein
MRLKFTQAVNHLLLTAPINVGFVALVFIQILWFCCQYHSSAAPAGGLTMDPLTAVVP